LQDIWNIFHNEISSPGPKLVVFDEIQLVPHWQNFIRNLYEKEKEVSIFITGSNSDMLSSELSSVLAGRCIEFFILPFSFQEVLSLKNIFIHDNADYFRQEKEILECFQEFFLYGGLPEVYSITTESARYSYLEGIVKKVILDDVIHRFQIKNTILLEELFSYVLNGVGNILFVNKLTKQINQIKKTKYLPSTLSDYLRYLEQAFSIFSVSKFDWKQSKIFDNTKKYYCIDLGIVNAFSQKNQSLESRKLENLVFLHLLKNKQKIFFGQDNTHKEIDFIVPRFHKYDKFQVCFSLSAENQLRELGNFALAEKYLSSSAQYLIVKNWDKNIILPPNIILREITRFLLDLEDT
jgi:predicted AAA+ superfamily ATPase